MSGVSIGEIVLYHPFAHEAIQRTAELDPIPAIVLAVHGAECVTIKAWDVAGTEHVRNAVPLYIPCVSNSLRPSAGFCERK